MRVILVIAILFITAPVYADYTIVLKDDSNVVIKTYTITNNQVLHLQKAASLTGDSILKQFEYAITNLIRNAKSLNTAKWRRDNEAYIEEQSRQ